MKKNTIARTINFNKTTECYKRDYYSVTLSKQEVLDVLNLNHPVDDVKISYFCQGDELEITVEYKEEKNTLSAYDFSKKLSEYLTRVLSIQSPTKTTGFTASIGFGIFISDGKEFITAKWKTNLEKI